MLAVLERFDGSRTVQSPEALKEGVNLLLVPRRNAWYEIIDYMRFDMTSQQVIVEWGTERSLVPVFKQRDEPYKNYIIATRSSPQSTHIKDSKFRP